MSEEAKIEGIALAKDGVWQVPPDLRPNNWQAMGLKEPETMPIAAVAVEVVPASAVAVEVSEPSGLPTTSVSAQKLDQVPAMQASLAEWCRIKLAKVKEEAKELQGAVEEALKHKWKASTLKTHARLADNRVIYYDKMLLALEAGYCLFPTVDCDIFAIRTDRDPKWQAPQFFAFNQAQRPGFDPQEAGKNLQRGIGEYVNPIPGSKGRYSKGNDYKGDLVGGYTHTIDDWTDVEFPVVMSKPHIMDAAGKAMALRVFDELGIITDHQRRSANVSTGVTKGDPIIVGRILNPKPNKPARSFLIAWHVDVDQDL